MENITVKDIVAATGGRLLCGNAAQKIEHLSIDSRTMKGNDLLCTCSFLGKFFELQHRSML